MNPPKKIAAIVTVYRPNSHADVIVGKVLQGYDQAGGPGPNLQLASLYVDQFPEQDLSRGLAKRFGFPMYDTIAGALCLGGDKLAVDGVLLIGEHGSYPSDYKQQVLFPRRRFFQEITDVFERSARSVPVFNDKHLSYSWTNAKWMVDRARALDVPFMAGTSLTVTFRRPPIQLPRNCALEEAVQTSYSGLDIYGFHGLDCLQSMAERRKGGETGVKAVQALRGEAMWKEFDKGGWSQPLLDAALAKVPNHEKGDYRELTAKNPIGALFFVEYRDGFRAVLAMMNGWAKGGDGEPMCFAGRLKGRAQPIAFQFRGGEDYPYAHFAQLLRAVDYMFQTGLPAYPVERTLLSTGILEAAMISNYEKGRRLETPHLDVQYQSGEWPFATDPIPTSKRRG